MALLMPYLVQRQRRSTLRGTFRVWSSESVKARNQRLHAQLHSLAEEGGGGLSPDEMGGVLSSLEKKMLADIQRHMASAQQEHREMVQSRTPTPPRRSAKRQAEAVPAEYWQAAASKTASPASSRPPASEPAPATPARRKAKDDSSSSSSSSSSSNSSRAEAAATTTVGPRIAKKPPSRQPQSGGDSSSSTSGRAATRGADTAAAARPSAVTKDATFLVSQNHLPEAPEELTLHIAFEGLKLTDGDTQVQLLAYEDILRFRRLKEGAGMSLSLKEGPDVVLSSEEGNKIYSTVQSKVKELAEMLQLDAASGSHSSGGGGGGPKVASSRPSPSAIGSPSARKPKGDDTPNKWLRRFSTSLAPNPNDVRAIAGQVGQKTPVKQWNDPMALAVAEEEVEKKMDEVVEAQAALRHKVSTLIRGGDVEFLTQQMPILQQKLDRAQKLFQKSIAEMPADRRTVCPALCCVQWFHLSDTVLA
eukprot:COSAG01_NODE_1714_length_9405_cov_6.727488_2_plen_475_part_00